MRILLIVAGSLVVAVALRWAYVKLRGDDGSVLHPWTLAIAAVAAVLGLGVGTPSAKLCRDAKPLEAADLLSSPPEGYEVVIRSRGEARKLLDGFIDEARAHIEEVTLAVAVPPDEDEGVAVYALSSAAQRQDPVGALDEFRSTYEKRPEDMKVGGKDGALHVDGEGAVAFAVVTDCGAVYLYGAAEETVREIAAALKPPEG